MPNTVQSLLQPLISHSQLTPGRCLAAPLALLLACSACSGPDTATGGEGEQAVTTVEAPSGIRLDFDRVVYTTEDLIRLSLDFGALEPESETLQVAVAAPDSGDAELLTLTRDERGTFSVPQGLPLSDSPAVPGDGRLSVAPGELLHALYAVDRTKPGLSSVASDLVTDVAVRENLNAPSVRVEPALDELAPLQGAKAAGTLLTRGGLPVQVALRELIVFPRNDAELTRFLARTEGEILGEQRVDSDTAGPDGARALLVRVSPPPLTASRLATLRALFGHADELVVSQPELLGLLASVLEARADGFVVSLNPLLRAQGAPRITPAEQAGTMDTPMSRVPVPGDSLPCIPGDPDHRCVLDVPGVWAFSALWEGDEQRVNAAVLDMGFVPSADFRRPDSGELRQCDQTGDLPLPGFAVGGFPCAPGIAEGLPTIPGKGWHGTGVVSTLGGVVNGGESGVGVAGFSAVPMLYENDIGSYAFETGAGIRQAVLDGASLINISGGYPCQSVTDLGLVEWCTVEGRAAICSVVTAGAALAASTTCATLGWIPFAGAAICGAALAGLAVETGVCIASLGYGDLKGPISSAVREATARGVPVIASAGNSAGSDGVPPLLRDWLNLDDARIETWGVIPASIPGVIAVGAVNGNPRDGRFLNNEELYGKRVDIWAPTGTSYWAPSDESNPASTPVLQQFYGTSAAAPFVSGVIASMQAINPDLDPANPALGPSARSRIVGRIRALLLETGYSNDQLKGFGYRDQPEQRRLLINAFGAVAAAAAPRLPFLADYDQSLGYAETTPNDTPLTATRLSFDSSTTGTVLSLPVFGAPAVTTDVDWYVVRMPGARGTPQTTTIELRYPNEWGFLELAGDPTATDVSFFRRSSFEYRILAPGGTDVRFAISGPGGNDNVYRVNVGTPELALPRLEIRAPVAGVPLCADPPVTLAVEARFDSFPDQTVPPEAIEWFDGDSSLGTGNRIERSLAPGRHALTVRAFGSDSASDRVEVDVMTCVDYPPTVTIVAPARDLILPIADIDAEGRWYVDVPVSALVTDPEDGSLSGSSVVWKTDRTDAQAETVGTGTNTTLRLYAGPDACDGVEHRIRVEATDSSLNRSVSPEVLVYATVLC